jgi:O-antigen/teichoic acid export membrane protein
MVLSANVTSTLRMATEHGDAVLIGALLGATAAGYLRIAKTISAAVFQLAWPIHYVLGPTITRYWASGEFDELSRLLRNAVAASFGVFLAATVSFHFLGPALIVTFYGPNYAPATEVTTIYVFAYAIIIVGAVIAPTIFAMGKPVYYTYIHVVGVIAFAISVYLTLPRLGLLSTGVGHVAYQTVWLLIGFGIVFSSVLRAKRRAARRAAARNLTDATSLSSGNAKQTTAPT